MIAIMRKIYATPEIEVFKTLLSESILEESGEVYPLANEDNTFEESDMATDLTVQQNLWDD